MKLPSVVSTSLLRYPRKRHLQVFLESRKFLGTKIISSDRKKGIPLTLYDARLNFLHLENLPSMLKLKSELLKIERNTDFAHVVLDPPVFGDNSLTKCGLQVPGTSPKLSPVSHRHKLFNISIIQQIYMAVLWNKILLNLFCYQTRLGL